MCLLNFFNSYGHDEGSWGPIPRGPPRVAWVVPVNMSELGASLQAIIDTMPQTTTLRLCHRFRDGPLSKLPQELLEHIIDDTQRSAREDCHTEWYEDTGCWQGMCLPEDHYRSYGWDVEEMWQSLAHDLEIDEVTRQATTEAEKLKMISNWASTDPELFHEDESFMLYDVATTRWLHRTCLCPKRHSEADRMGNNFMLLNNASGISSHSEIF
jgi:hypothetical protein